MTDDEREAYEERAAIAEYEGGLSRADAEQLARKQIARHDGKQMEVRYDRIR